MTDSQHYLERELQMRLRQDNEIFAFLERGSLDGVWFWDLENPEHEWMSPSFWRTLGFDPDEREHLAAEWQDLIHPEDLQLAGRNFELHCADPDHAYDQVVRYQHRDGSTVWVRCRGLALRDEAGRPVRMLGAHTDITGLMRKEEELRRRNEDLMTYAYAASHDLRAPLRGIAHLAEWIEEDAQGPLGAEAEQHLKDLRERVQKMDQLLEDLMAHARIGSETYAFENVDLERVAGEALALLGGEGVRLEVDGPKRLRAPRVPLELVVRNLFSNALEHHDREQKSLRITAIEGAGEWRIRIEDDGPGIPQERAEKAFELFRKLSSKSKGSGLGLAIARRAIERCGGSLVLASDGETRGACFEMRLPFESPMPARG